MSRQLTVTLAIVSAMLLGVTRAHALDVGARPKYSAKAMDGRSFNSQMLLGRVVVLDFWATWCGPCVASIPHLKELNEKYSSKGVVLISVSVDQSESKVKEFIAAREMNWLQVFDAKQTKELDDMFSITAYPTIIMIAPTGEIIWRGHPNGLEKQIEEALAKYPVVLDPAARLEQARLAIADACDLIDRQVNYAKALELLADIPDKTLENDEIVALSAALVQRFASTDDTVKSRIDEALAANPAGAKKLETLRAAHKTVDPAAIEAERLARESAKQQQRVDALETRATAKLRIAEKLMNNGNHVGAYRQLLWIVNKAGDTTAASEADTHITGYESDDVLMKAFERDEID